MTTISTRPHRETGEPHWIEWVTGTVSALLVVAMIGWIGLEALMEEDLPPEFSIAITGRAAVEGGHRVEFVILNKANQTAAAVVVRGEVLDGGKAVEAADITFDYVPADSKASGAILFLQDPGEREIRIRALGYTDP
ncbi:TIGR02588 family protein [Neorhizobium alkalisoli]|uniref:TIGR02588 family protein n=1 Tax=Neorhizobium alkalisoli TaxID=528178 RepID=UPI000CF90198|nr:TIGR02588 family protein [Neorhizobium alkalisoli]